MAFDYPAVIPWLLFGAVAVAILIASVSFVWCFKESSEWALVPSIVTVLGLTIILLCSFLIPIDIFTVSHTMDPAVYSLPLRILYYSTF